MAEIVKLTTRIERLEFKTYREINRLRQEIRQTHRKPEAKSPRKYYHQIKHILPSPAKAYLDGFTQLIGEQHWRDVTQSSIAKMAGKSLPTIKRGQRILQDLGTVYVKHNYRPKPRKSRKPSPTRTSSFVWLIGLTKLLASIAQLEDLDNVPAEKLYDRMRPSVRLDFGKKLPPEDKFLSIKNRVLKYQTDPNSFLDTLRNPEAGKSPGPRKKSTPSILDPEGTS